MTAQDPKRGFTLISLLLANARRSCKGFTLIELLVVIAIIAILATIGFTVFSGAQKSARDAKRRGDLNAISKAIEVNKSPSAYLPLQTSWFAAGALPTDPLSYPYCLAQNASAIPANPAATWTTACPSGYQALDTAAPTMAYWKICAVIETGSTYQCAASTQ